MPKPFSPADSAQIAAYLATRGATICPAGARTITDQEFWAHRHDAGRLSRERLDGLAEQQLIDQRHVTIDASGREYVTNGLGERIT